MKLFVLLILLSVVNANPFDTRGSRIARSAQAQEYYGIYDGQDQYGIYNMGCIPHDGACIGNHGLQGMCCGGTYCHKSNPTWAEGRCYNRN